MQLLAYLLLMSVLHDSVHGHFSLFPHSHVTNNQAPSPVSTVDVLIIKDKVEYCSSRFVCGVILDLDMFEVDCVDVDKVCDGHRNCLNGLDEASCSIKQMQCKDKNMSPCADDTCGIICDGKKQCLMGEDENGCPSGCACTNEQYQCQTGGMCVDLCRVCNGINDCPNGDDEFNCPAKACPNGHFRCRDDSTCVPKSQVCDGDADCPDGDDEEQCAPHRCPPMFYACNSAPWCIPPYQLCNGVINCPGSEDEANCDLCPLDTYQCLGNTTNCITNDHICDGNPDCENGEDELHCEPGCFCQPGDYICMSGQCVSKLYLCDGNDDCADSEDELIERDTDVSDCSGS